MEQGAKDSQGTRSALTLPSEAESSEVQPRWDCYRRETEQLPNPRAAALPEVKKERKFLWVSGESGTLDFCQS